MPTPFSDEEVRSKLSEIPNWTVNQSGKLELKLNFQDFISAFAFLSAVGIESEKQNHHAEIFNVYSTVRLELTTHDAGGITDKDLKLAKTINSRIPKALNESQPNS